MKYCGNCGTQLEDDMIFCTKCGAKKTPAPAAPPVNAAPYQPQAKKSKAPVIIISVAAVVAVILGICVIAYIVSGGGDDTSGGGPFGGSVNKLDFTLYNYTDIDIYSIYLSPTDGNAWGKNTLGNNVLYAWGQMNITFPYEDGSVYYWDLRVMDGYGNAVDWKCLDLRNITNLYISINEYGQAYAEWN